MHKVNVVGQFKKKMLLEKSSYFTQLIANQPRWKRRCIKCIKNIFEIQI